MYLNFSNFGEEPRLGRDKPWSKNEDKCQMGGLTKFSPDAWGTPQSPLEKKPWLSGIAEMWIDSWASKLVLVYIYIPCYQIQNGCKIDAYHSSSWNIMYYWKYICNLRGYAVSGTARFIWPLIGHAITLLPELKRSTKLNRQPPFTTTAKLLTTCSTQRRL